MRIIKYPQDFHILQSVYLNDNKDKIGEIVVLKGTDKKWYLTMRRLVGKKGDYGHYFVIFGGSYGIDKALIKRMISGKPDDILKNIDQIVIFYIGKTEKRFYASSPEDWFDKGQSYGTAKDLGDGIYSFGDQYLLRESDMKCIGISPDDDSVVK